MAAGFLAMLGGLILLVVPLVMGTNGWKRRRTWTRADGAITSVTERRTSNQSDPATTTVIRYRFADARGKSHGGTSTTFFRKPKRGSRISVRYDPDAPDTNEPAVDFVAMMVFVVGLPIPGACLVLWGFLGMVTA